MSWFFLWNRMQHWKRRERNQWSLTLISVNLNASARLWNSHGCLVRRKEGGGFRQGDEYYTRNQRLGFIKREKHFKSRDPYYGHSSEFTSCDDRCCVALRFSVSWALVGLLAVRWHSTPREFARMNYKPAGAPNCAFSIVLVDLAPFFNVFLETSSNSTKAHTHTNCWISEKVDDVVRRRDCHINLYWVWNFARVLTHGDYVYI
jgi:hypothetical protein